MKMLNATLKNSLNTAVAHFAIIWIFFFNCKQILVEGTKYFPHIKGEKDYLTCV